VINNPANPNEFITSQIVRTNLKKVVPSYQDFNTSDAGETSKKSEF